MRTINTHAVVKGQQLNEPSRLMLFWYDDTDVQSDSILVLCLLRMMISNGRDFVILSSVQYIFAEPEFVEQDCILQVIF